MFPFGGERGIRTPGPVTVNGFQDRRIRPLCQLSAAKVRVRMFLAKKITDFICGHSRKACVPIVFAAKV